jgi:DNA-binding NarL/FixJ family response regulator
VRTVVAGRGRFVGRAGELAALVGLLTFAGARSAGAGPAGSGAGGSGAGAVGVGLVGGDPGIGKTRLLEELGRVAAARGWTVLSVSAPAVGAAPAFWPWRQVVRQWLATEGGPRLLEALARDDSWLGLLGMDSGTDLGTGSGSGTDLGADSDSGWDPDPTSGWDADAGGNPSGAAAGPPAAPSPESRFVAFERFAGAIAEAAGPGGVLLLLDDVHRFDPDSLSLLTGVVGQPRPGRLVVVAACRPRELAERPAGEELRGLVARHPHSASVTLGGWSSAEVEAGLQGVLGRRTEPAVLAAVHARTRGNPLFVHEISRLLAAGLAPDALLPDLVRDVVREHLGRLSPGCHATLTSAAVLGFEIEPAAVGSVSDADPADVLGHLDEAVRGGVVERRAGGRFGFVHDLFSETLLADLPSVELATAHLRVATALERAGRPRPVEIARHRLAALPLGDPAAASAAAYTAGAAALAELAFETAAELFASALDTAPAELPAARRCELLIALGRARFILRDTMDAVDRCIAAGELAVRTGDAESLGRACLALPEFPDPRWTLLVATWCEQALAGLSEGDSSLRTQLLAQQAIAHLFVGEPARVVAISRAALAMARRVGDDDALSLALRARQLACADPAGHAERLVLGAEMLALGRRRADPESVFWGHLWRFDALAQAGRIDHGLAELDQAEPVATRLGRPVVRWHVLRSRVAVAIGQGRFREATRLIGLERECAPDGLTARAPYWSALLVARLTGNTRDVPADPLPANYDHPIAAVGEFLHIAPWHLALGREAEAAALHRALPAIDSPRIPPFVRMPIDAVRAEIAAALGDTEAAEAAYRALLPHADLHVVAGAGVSITYGSAHLPLGLAAAALGRPDAAIEHFRAAVLANDQSGLAPFAALARYQLAAALHTRGGPGDLAEARRQLRHAAATAEQLGMAPLRGRATELADRLAGAPGGEPLTPRQREIAALLAQGRSNRQIAHELHISERTAENHVRNIMAALGAANRVQVATRMARDRLGDPS